MSHETMIRQYFIPMVYFIPSYLLLTLLFFGVGNAQSTSKVEIAVLGTFHFTQVHQTENENQNFYGSKRQEDLKEFIQVLKTFYPTDIYIEREPKIQHQIDSIYLLFKNDQLKLEDLKRGTSEVFQVGFRLAKTMNLGSPTCIDYHESISQSLIKSGNHFEIYRNSLKAFQNLGRKVLGEFIRGEASLLETLVSMNLPENIKRSHTLLFNVPAYVTYGEFASYDNLEEENIDKRYIGAEFIALFYRRNLKIHSNILTAQQKQNSKRILCIIGQTHVGVLQELLRNNEAFQIIEPHTLLNRK